MSRILMLIRIPEKDAVKITLEIKEDLVKQNKIEVTQEELEQLLFGKIN